MRRVLCFICPPLAVLLWGSPSEAAVNVLLCCLLFVPGVIHALNVVADFEARLDWTIRNRGIRSPRPRKKSDTPGCGATPT